MKKQYGKDGPPQFRRRHRPLSEPRIRWTGFGFPLADTHWMAQIVCHCGHEVFRVLRGDADNTPGWRDASWTFSMTDLCCTACAQQSVYFYDGFHGYNAVICGEREKAIASAPDFIEVNRALLKPLSCLGCGKDRFHVLAGVSYDSEDVQDLTQNPDDWDEAYGSFTGIGWCHDCGERLDIQETTGTG